MHRLLSVLLAALSLAGALAAQEPTEYDRIFRRGYDAVVSGDTEVGIEAFKKCHEMRPTAAIPVYNLACCYSLRKEIDTAFEWLEKAVALGYTSVEFMSNDSDLENLRSDPRWAALVERIAAMLKMGEEYAKEAAVHVPASLEAAVAAGEELPLLIVLHDVGDTKAELVAGPWKGIAEELGLVLIAPSGRFLAAGSQKPEDGMAWWDNDAGYMEKPWQYEKPVDDAYSAFKKKHKIDRKRIYLAGEGAACVPAMNIAVTYPGLYKGVVLVNGLFNAQMSGPKCANAGKMGMRLRVVLTPAFEVPGGPAQLAAGLRPQMEQWGMDFDLKAAKEDNLAAAIAGSVRSLFPAESEPVEAGGGAGAKSGL